MKNDRKKVYYKVLQKKNKYYLTLVQRHKYLFENQLVRFVPNQSTPTNKKYDAIYLDKNKLTKLIVSKGLNPAIDLIPTVFNTSPDLKTFNDVLSFSQLGAMMSKVSYEKSENPYLMTGKKKPIVLFNEFKRTRAARGINRVLRVSGLKEIEGVVEWPYNKKPEPRIARKIGKQVQLRGQLGPKGIDIYRLELYREHRGWYPGFGHLSRRTFNKNKINIPNKNN